MSTKVRVAVSACVAIGALATLANSAQATFVPGSDYWNWCRNGAYVCIWDQTWFNGQGEAWRESDSNWHVGWGTRIKDDDDSAMNYAGGYNVASFNNVNLGGGCQWTIGYNNYASNFTWNDDGSSHKRYSVNPC